MAFLTPSRLRGSISKLYRHSKAQSALPLSTEHLPEVQNIKMDDKKQK
jgi:hypothetical protein